MINTDNKLVNTLHPLVWLSIISCRINNRLNFSKEVIIQGEGDSLMEMNRTTAKQGLILRETHQIMLLLRQWGRLMRTFKFLTSLSPKKEAMLPVSIASFNKRKTSSKESRDIISSEVVPRFWKELVLMWLSESTHIIIDNNKCITTFSKLWSRMQTAAWLP